MEAIGLSKKGLRQENQDSFLIDQQNKLYIVADGMGGHNAGQLASTIAINSADKFFKKYNEIYSDKNQLIIKSMDEANKDIIDYANVNPETVGMGTTMTFMHLDDKAIAYIGHIGDSRAYLINAKGIVQLTDDHSYVGELLRTGGITEEDALNHPQRNLLMRAMGVAADVEIDILTHQVHNDDMILLCTDGLFNVLSNNDIKHIVLQNSVKDAVEVLVNTTLLNGGNDNVTVVLVKYN